MQPPSFGLAAQQLACDLYELLQARGITQTNVGLDNAPEAALRTLAAATWLCEPLHALATGRVTAPQRRGEHFLQPLPSCPAPPRPTHHAQRCPACAAAIGRFTDSVGAPYADGTLRVYVGHVEALFAQLDCG